VIIYLSSKYIFSSLKERERLKVEIAANNICKKIDLYTGDVCASESARFRLHDKGLVNFYDKNIEWDMPNDESVPYFLGKAFNPEEGGRIRYYPRIKGVFGSVDIIIFMARLILEKIGEYDAYNGFVDFRCHVVSYNPNGGEVAATPDLIHSDNVGKTAIFLLEKNNIDGGMNEFFTNEAEGLRRSEVKNSPILSVDLNSLLDGVIWDDRSYTHYVTPVSCRKSEEPGRRVVIIFDVGCERASNYVK